MERSFCLIGEDSLVIQCGNILLKQNFLIKLVISPVKSIQEWASANNIPMLSTFDSLLETPSFEVDYLFSIVNSRILPASILNRASKLAINYHDSLLPKYAGLNATSWAILHNEKEHGITWHVMNEKIDEGDIINQTKFPVYPTDSALTLNLRCYEHAIHTFSEIIKAIDENKLTTNKQKLHERSYFSASHHLPCFGFINWISMSGEYIERLNRALTMGNYNNFVGSVKLIINDNYLIVKHIEIAPSYSSSSMELGQILSTDKKLTIATKTVPISISEFSTKFGESISVEKIITLFDLKVGDKLPLYDASSEEIWRGFETIALKNERNIMKRLGQISEHNAFPPQSLHSDKVLKEIKPKISLQKLFPNKNFSNSQALLLTSILVYLLRLNDHEPVSIFFTHPKYELLKKQQIEFFSHFFPFTLKDPGDCTLQQILDYVTNKLKKIENYPLYTTDILSRHPFLGTGTIDSGIVINLNPTDDIVLQENTLLHFSVDASKEELRIWHRMNLAFHGGELTEIIKNSTQHILNILLKLINNPHVNIQTFCFLTPMERYELLNNWGLGTKRYYHPQSISMEFKHHVEHHPEKPALMMGDKSISYHELDEQSDKIATYLLAKKIPAQTFIGLYHERGMEMIAAILGILKAGCVYVPLDIKYPLFKIEQIVDDTQLRIMFVGKDSKAKFKDFFNEQNREIDLLQVDTILATPLIEKPLQEVPFNEDELVYIMFTSGTTGRPKGVMVTQKNVLNYCHWFAETTQFNQESIIDFSSSIAFDLSIPCTLAALLAGGTIAIASSTEKGNPKLFLEHLAFKRITHAELTPGYMEMLLGFPAYVKRLADLQFLLLGADVVPTNDVMRWLSLCPNHQIVNEYGPTETTVSATSYFVDKEALVDEASVPIGRPGFNSTCYVLDKYKNLCPSGIKGELYIGGEQVTKGYLNRPDLTEQKFIVSNFSSEQEVIYKTGDIVCWLPDGNLQFFGRNDHQVKIQGYRIELSSIEAILIKMPSIEQVVVVALKGMLKENYLRAYVISRNEELCSSEIRTFLMDYLPLYMIPREFCRIQHIPLKENEKIDFSALERLDYKLLSFESEESSEALTTEELEIKKIWEKVFHLPISSIHDNFFEKGGDSLMAMQIVSELKSIYKVDIALQIIFEYPTIHSLALAMPSKSNGLVTHKKSMSDSLIRLSKNENNPILFLIHPVGGSIFWYQELAKHLEGIYTVYGIQDLSLERSNFRFHSLEDMAGYYVEEIKKVSVDDNYNIAGASFGATVAFEMAHQLIRNKKNISFLGLLDGWASYPCSIMKTNTLDFLEEKEINRIDAEQLRLLNELEQYRKNLLLNYKLNSLPSNAVLFKAKELWPAFAEMNDEWNGWYNLIEGRLNKYDVPGNHESMFFSPFIEQWAKNFREND